MKAFNKLLVANFKQFVRDNPEKVRRGTKFSQLTDFQRDRIIEEALKSS